MKSVLRLSWADLWPFYGLYCKRFSLYVKVYPSEAAELHWALYEK